MDSLSSPTLDEAHCPWPLCSHTCSWEAEQRIHIGKPRKVKALASSTASATVTEEDAFPAITVVNASQWLDDGSPIEVFPLGCKDDLSEATTNTLISCVASPRGARRRENVQIPTSSSAMATHLETQRENKTVKLRTIHIALLPSNTSTFQPSKPIVMWVPSSCYLPPEPARHISELSGCLGAPDVQGRPCLPPHDSQHSAMSPRLAVKELIFPPSAEMNKCVVNKRKLKQDESRKRALLKQTFLKSELNQEGKGSLKSEADTDLSDPGLSRPGSESDRQAQKASAPPQAHCLVAVGQTLAAAPEAKDDQQQPRPAQTLPLRDNPVIFEPVWERIQRKHTLTSKYKRDQKAINADAKGDIELHGKGIIPPQASNTVKLTRNM